MKRVLVVDDSSFMRKSLTHLLEADRAITVVGTAADGAEALRQVKTLGPDVVVLDLEMAVMHGLAALTHIMAECPTPVLVLTGVGHRDAAIAVQCLERGAVDFIPKPSGVISYDIGKLGPELIAKVKLAAEVDVRRLAARAPSKPAGHRAGRAPHPEQIVVIGASTGGPRAVGLILPGLPPDLAAVVLVVQHMAPEFVGAFADRLRLRCPFATAVARPDEPLTPGRVVVAPGGCHTLVAQTAGRKHVRFSRKVSPHAIFPSVDYALETAAAVYGAGTIGVVLTGMGTDGARGLQAVKDAGGRTIAEDPSTCLVFGMPRAAVDLGCVDRVVPLPRMAEAISELL